jgi:hypothetical protein
MGMQDVGSRFGETALAPFARAASLPAATKNKVEIRGMFFSTQKHAVTAPRLPRIPPQLHHKNTTPKTHIFPKHPSKTPIKPHLSHIPRR